MTPKAVVYVLHRRDGSSHNLTKVGSTRISADSRAANYTDGGWVAYFTAEVSAHVRYAVEKKAHSILSERGFWLDPTILGGTAQEIFTCSPQDAKDAILAAMQIVKGELADFIGDEIALYLMKTKNKVLEVTQELEGLKKLHKDQSLTSVSYKIINEAEHIKKLQDRIRILDRSLSEKDREISSLRTEITRLNDTLGDNEYRSSRKRGR